MPRLHERGASSKPVHILGIADTESIPKLVTYGADTFDSCYPTRVGRHGSMLTANGPLRVVSQAFPSHTQLALQGACIGGSLRAALRQLRIVAALY